MVLFFKGDWLMPSGLYLEAAGIGGEVEKWYGFLPLPLALPS